MALHQQSLQLRRRRSRLVSTLACAGLLLSAGPALGQGCSFSFGGPPTPSTWSSPGQTARHALADAWSQHVDYNFDHGGNAYREFGGWIYETDDGQYGYTPPRMGSESRVGLGNMVTARDGGYVLTGSGQRVVGVYHIHPENMRGPHGEHWRNDRFSDADKDIAEDYGVPNYLRYSGGYHVYDPAVNSPDDLPSAWGDLPPEEDEGSSASGCSVASTDGEPHFTTHDGRHFDFHGAGEYIALTGPSDGFTVMLRLEPWLDFKTVSILTALALKTGDDRIGVYFKEPYVRINGQPMQAARRTLSDGTAIERVADVVRIRTGAGDSLIVDGLGGGWLNAGLRLMPTRKGAVRGLWGDFDGDRDNDFKTRDGRQVEFFSADKDEFRERLYKVWGDSWRITPDESLFDYQDGAGSEDYQLRDHPAKITPRQAVEADPAAEGAQEACRQAGVIEPSLLKNCIYDAVVTGAASVASSYASFSKEMATLSSEAGLTVAADTAGGGENDESVETTPPAQPQGLGTGRILGGFANAAETLHLVGDASTDDQSRLVLTRAAPDQKGAVFMPQRMRLDSGFTATFDVIVDQPGGAADSAGATGGDGLAYVLTTALPDRLSGPGAGLGYAGLADVLAIEFDTFRNAYDPSSMHVSVNRAHAGGSAYEDDKASLATAPIPAIDDGAVHHIKINWRRGQLAVFVDDMTTPVLDAPLKLSDYFDIGEGAYVGVAAATSDAYERHRLTFWSHWSY